MRLISEYAPPASIELEELKERLGFTGTQMAELAGVTSDSQWRKYTNSNTPRAISFHMLFFMASQLTLPETVLSEIINKMKEIGAQVK